MRQDRSSYGYDLSAFRTIRAQLMLRTPKPIEDGFVKCIEATNRIADQDPNDFFNPETQRIEFDWSEANEALAGLRLAMQTHIETSRNAQLDGLHDSTDENRLLP
jgi:hypothetical protein